MSLSQQLKQINEKSASVALDRKSRAKLHSKSLIFAPKVAATQDYDYLHLVGVDGLTELCTIDSRFSKFQQTLFADSTVNFDRNVQTKEIVDNLDASIAAFLNLVSPLYPLSPAVKAVEWLVRRYYINIHNSEALILTCLPHYQLQIFARVMNVIPKSLWPPIFNWLNGYRDMAKNPPSSSILKAFRNDYQLFKLYSEYLTQQVLVETVFKEQLVFYLTNTIQLLASYSTDIEKLNEVYLPVILEVIGKFLLALNTSLDHDIKIAAYTLMSVVVSLVPLADDVHISLTKSVLQVPGAFDTELRRQTVIILAQTWQRYTGARFEFEFFSAISVESLLKDNLLESLVNEGFDINNLLLAIISSTNDKSILTLAKLFKIEHSSEAVAAEFISRLIDAASSKPDTETRSLIVEAFESMLADSRDTLMAYLGSRKEPMSLADLEMVLLTTLSSNDADDSEINVAQSDEVQQTNGSSNGEQVTLEGVKSQTKSFLFQSEDFNDLARLLVSFLAPFESNSYANQISKFCTAVFTGSAASITFTLRCSLTPMIPLKVRLACLIFLKRKLKELAKSADAKLHLLLPILILGLYDDHQSIRTGFAESIHSISTPSASKNSSIFLEDEMYADVAASNKVLISPKDGDSLISLLTSTDSLLKETVLDKTRLVSVLFEVIFKAQLPSKKFGLICQTFLIAQWSQLPFAAVFKSLIFKIMSERNVAAECPIRESFIKGDAAGLFSNFEAWMASAQESKLDFENDIVIPLVNLVGGQDELPNALGIDEVGWLIKATDFSKCPVIQVAATKRVVQVFGFVKAEDKVRLYSKFIELQASDDEVNFDAQEILQAMPLDFSSALTLLKNFQLVAQIPEQQIPKRKRRSSNSSKQTMAHEELVTIASVHLRKLTIVLDLLEYNLRKNLKEIKPELLLSFFGILTDLEYLGHDGDMPVLYTQEVLASCMLLAVKHIKAINENGSGRISIDSNSVRADLIVNTIRSSHSPQIQNRLLLVIAELASLAPEIILHSVMPIFTFMGAHTIRQDDEFSSFALQDTIAKVVPALAKSGASSFNNEIEFLLTSFVTAFQHIPRHRRVKLFSSLSKTLGADNSIHTILFLLGVQYASLFGKGKHGDCRSLLEFTQSYMKQFQASEQLSAIHRYCTLWQLVPTKPLDPDSDEFRNLNSRPIFGASILSLSDTDLVELKAGLVSFIDNLLQTDEESVGYLQLKVNQLLLDSRSTDVEKTVIIDGCKNVASLLLSSLDDFSELSRMTKISDNLYQFLDDVLSLLPLVYFLDSIIDVLKNPIGVDRVAINFARLSGNKIENELTASNLDEQIQYSLLEKLIPVLISGIKSDQDAEISQAYMDATAQAVAKLGNCTTCFKEAKNVSVLNECLSILTSESGLKSSKPECIISSMNCISSIINIMGVKAIGFFPKIFEPTVEIWKTTKTNEEDTQLVQMSVLLLFAQLVKKLPAFVTSKLDSIFTCTIESLAVDAAVRSSILSSIVEYVDTAYVLKALCNVWGEISKSDNAEVIGLYLGAMEKTIDHLEKKSAISQATLFIKWMIKAFEFRLSASKSDQDFDTNTIHRLESSFHSCGLRYVMKLNDKTFRPLFAGLVRWAVNGEGSTSDIDEVSRYIAFFRFFNKVQEQLKSIITSYYSYLIDPVSSLLKKIDGMEDSINLKRMVFNSLTSSFKYDQDDFWSQPLRFESICGPLLQQIPTVENSIGKYLVKCVSAFVVNVSSEEHNEKLVHGLIHYISNEHSTTNSHTKTWTIRILKSVFQKMGDQWLSYLPTLIPYIAELLEDDDEDVELEVRKGLVKVIENVLGEPLDRYLN